MSTPANVVNTLRLEDFDFDLAKKDNLVFVDSQLREAGAHIDAAAVDEADAFAAFAQNDVVLESADQELNSLPGQGRGKCFKFVICFPRRGIYSVGPIFQPIVDGLTKYTKELTDSATRRGAIVTDFADSNTLANTPLVYLTYDNPPAPSSGGGQLPPGVGRNIDGNPRLDNLPIPPIKHDFGATPPAGSPATPTPGGA